MADNTDLTNLPRATSVPKKRMRLSVVWVIPIVAAVLGLGIAIQQILNEGPTITLVFQSANGVEAGKTFVKYKDVNIGQVTAVTLSGDYSKVVVTAKIAKSAEGLLVEDAKFWVVKARITLSGVSGLGTLLAGNYIGFEVGKSTTKRREFTGLEIPPIVTSGQPGRQFVLRADDLGSLGIGSPLYYRRLQVGQVVAYDLANDGKSLDIKVFVNAPYDRFVATDTRFWNASGVTASLGANGLDVRTESVLALILGGIAFEAPGVETAAEPAAANTVFTLFSDRARAMKQPDSIVSNYVLYFNESLRGLSVGAPVTFFGLQVGEVTDVGLEYEPATLDVRARVNIAVYPKRFIARLQNSAAAAGLPKTEAARHALLQRLVEQRDLRAQLRSSNLLTGQMFIAFDYFPNAPKVKLDWTQDPPQLPVMPGALAEIETKLNAVLSKLDKLPVEAIGDNMKQVLATLDQTIKDASKLLVRVDGQLVPETRKALEDLRRTLLAAERVMASADTTLIGQNAPAQQELRDALQEIARAARGVRVLTDYLERNPSVLIRGKTEEKP